MNEKSRMLALYEPREELEALFGDEFMRRHTNFQTFEEFRFSGAVFVDWGADFIVAPRAAFDCCVQGKTCFNTWDEMYEAAYGHMRIAAAPLENYEGGMNE